MSEGIPGPKLPLTIVLEGEWVMGRPGNFVGYQASDTELAQLMWLRRALGDTEGPAGVSTALRYAVDTLYAAAHHDWQPLAFKSLVEFLRAEGADE